MTDTDQTGTGTGRTAAARRELAARQATLLAALLGKGPAPRGVDPDLIRAQAHALLAKRRRVVERHLEPGLVDDLGGRLGPLFAAYAAAHPRRCGTSTRQDAATFRRWLADKHIIGPPTMRDRLAQCWGRLRGVRGVVAAERG